MKLRYFLLFFIVFLQCDFLLISCRTKDTDRFKADEVSANEGAVFAADEAMADEANAVTADEAPEPEAAMVLDLAEGPNFILLLYRDPLYREEVAAFFRKLCGSADIAEVILKGSDAFNIRPALAFSLCAEESAYNPHALNRNKNDTIDRGLFQLNSQTFPKLKVEDFYNPSVNARYGLAHLRWCLDTAGTELAGLAMYNAGSSRVNSIGTPKKTLDYISRILMRQQKIEELFLSEYAGFNRGETIAEEIKKPFVLSLLTPLGGR